MPARPMTIHPICFQCKPARALPRVAEAICTSPSVQMASTSASRIQSSSCRLVFTFMRFYVLRSCGSRFRLADRGHHAGQRSGRPGALRRNPGSGLLLVALRFLVEIGFDDVPRQRSGRRGAMFTMFDQHGHDDLRIIPRIKTHEPGVVLELPVAPSAGALQSLAADELRGTRFAAEFNV